MSDLILELNGEIPEVGDPDTIGEAVVMKMMAERSKDTSR